MTRNKLVKMSAKVQRIKQTAVELQQLSSGIQAIDKNADRILASVKMLEINISDIVSIL